MCLEDGVTGWVDAGSGGADNMDQVRRRLQGRPANRPRAHQYCAHRRRPGRRIATISTGPMSDLARGAIARNRDVVIGVRRACRPTWAAPTISSTAARAGGGRRSAGHDPCGTETTRRLRSLLGLLKRGDIVTHIYAPNPNGLIDEKGKLIPEVLAARRRGIHFDFGNGIQRPLRLGDGRSRDQAGFLARYVLHRLERDVAHPPA